MRQRYVEALRVPDGGVPITDPVVVGVSGGLDSTVLLHLLRFAGRGEPGPDGVRGPPIVAAHFDHRMRSGSDADALWLRGLCSAWGVELVAGAALAPPSSEAEARRHRYAFLHEVRRARGARFVATAHHADDQAETVLFRVLRGTGPVGLRGVLREREDGVWRPLLDVWRDDVLAYARAVGLGWREDPTNGQTDFARNALRHHVLPDVERLVAPGARRAVVRFAERAAHDEEGWESLVPGLIDSVHPERDGERVTVDREALTALHPAVRARVLRALAAELGLRPNGRVTALAVDFAASGASGHGIDLGGAVTLRRELDRLVLARSASAPPPDRALRIPGPAGGSGEVLLSGASVWVGWGEEAERQADFVERFVSARLRFPLVVRAWEAGDRIRTRVGARKLKHLFREARVPAPRRSEIPVLADAAGDVLWIPGVARADAPPPAAGSGGRETLPIGFA
ncbi:MAG: tRNA lysidine(34) synthetase TilS [Gemmatimonadota bacterium]|nr:tRNA lysidine(34) synthetase TilS [Gemmatimonadota bacterium]